MKHIYTLIITLFVLIGSAQAQVTIFHENFSGNTNGETYQGSPDWQYSNVVPSTGTASGGMHVRTTPSNKSNETSTLSFNGSFSTIGYNNIKISWVDYRTEPKANNRSNNNEVILFYSTDNGSTYTRATVTQTTSTTTWNAASASLPIADVAANRIRLRWQISTPSTNQDYYAIDDITITGMPEEGLSTFDWATRPLNENPFIVSAPNSPTPYTTDGIKMFWSRTSGTNVNLTESQVTTRFQAPKQSLSLVQSGASSTVGTDVQVQFSESVSDLAMTLFDIDQASGQFQDRIVIIGYNELGAEVLPSRNRVIRTSNTRYTETSGTVVGQSVNDIASTSNLADVKITFSTAVVRVVLRYFNDDSARGQQGIAISNLSWRFVQPIISLPVELVSFRGQANADGVNLTWRTASEQDNMGFEVQVSTDGKIFRKVGFVESRVGTTSLMQHYSFRDPRAASGTNYYRLKQIDFDGTFEYSKTIAVNLTLASSSAVYPTLATSDITVRLVRTDEQVTILIADMAGKQLVAVQNPADRQLVMPVQHLQNGVYFVTVITGEHKEVFRFVKR